MKNLFSKTIQVLLMCMACMATLKAVAQQDVFSGYWKCKLIYQFSNFPMGKDEKHNCELFVKKINTGDYVAITVYKEQYTLSLGKKEGDKIVFTRQNAATAFRGYFEISKLWLDEDGKLAASGKQPGNLINGELAIGKSIKESAEKYEQVVAWYVASSPASARNAEGVWEGTIKSYIEGGGINRWYTANAVLYVLRISEREYGVLVSQDNEEFCCAAVVDPKGNLKLDNYFRTPGQGHPTILGYRNGELNGEGSVKATFIGESGWFGGSSHFINKSGSLPAGYKEKILQCYSDAGIPKTIKD